MKIKTKDILIIGYIYLYTRFFYCPGKYKVFDEISGKAPNNKHCKVNAKHFPDNKKLLIYARARLSLANDKLKNYYS